jgi:molybdopterin/thiamine biosynthesis adenylyltransferase
VRLFIAILGKERGFRMKRIKITFLEKLFSMLKNSLKWDDGKEKSSYVLCHSCRCKDKIKFLPYKVIIPSKADYIRRSSGFLELSKSFISKVFNEAIDTGSDVIQCHVHPYDPGGFSSIDAAEEPLFMRHIASKINGIYHASLVFGNSLSTLDGWFYDRDSDKLIGVDKVLVVGKKNMEIYVPDRSRLSNQKTPASLGRSVLAFGKEAMRFIGLLDFGVVGASALGGPVVELLARDKVNSIFLCDFDTIEETNLNRLPGTTPLDIGKPKVDFYAEKINKISPEVEVETFQRSFYDTKVQLAFSQADMIFGCVDSGARLSINRLAMANLVPYFDLGAMVEIKDGRLSFIGGQVYNVIPGRKVCLSCSGAFDHFLPEYNSPKKNELDIEQGYVKGDINIPSPSVMYLDSVIAGLGYSEFLKYVLGRRENEIYKVYYDEISNKLVSSICSESGCIACRDNDYLGKGDKIPSMIPRKDVDFKFPNRMEGNDFQQHKDLIQTTSASG